MTLVVLASLAFVALGLPDGLLGVAWPSMRADFGLRLEALGPLLVSFTAGYVASSFAGGRLLARLGLGPLLVLSCAATGASLLGYAGAPFWTVVVALAFIGGLGAGGIDAGINTYAARHHGPRMLNWLHACFGIGAAGGPAIMTAVLAANLPWQRGYAVVGVAQLALAATFVPTMRAWPSHSGSERAAAARRHASIAASLRLPVVRRNLLLFFAYTGLELSLNAWTFTLLTDGRGVSMMWAGSSISLFWVALTVGRLLGAAFADAVSPGILVRGCLMLLAAAVAVLAVGFSRGLDLAALIVAGAAAGPVFPTLVATTPSRVGDSHAANAVGFQIAAAALGQAAIPSILGVIGHRWGLEALAVGLAAAGVIAVISYLAVDLAVPDIPEGAGVPAPVDSA